MSKIRSDLIIHVHAIKNKMGNYMRIIREELKIQLGYLFFNQAELEERLVKQMENIASIVQQQKLQETMEATWPELEAHLIAVEAGNSRAGGGGPGSISLQ
jgi:hypothetical protein